VRCGCAVSTVVTLLNDLGLGTVAAARSISTIIFQADEFASREGRSTAVVGAKRAAVLIRPHNSVPQAEVALCKQQRTSDAVCFAPMIPATCAQERSAHQNRKAR